MPYLGNPPAEAYSSVTKDSFSGDGSTTAFTLSVPSTTNNMRVVVENVIQDPTVAYTVSGTTLTFTSAPPTGTNNIYAVNLGPAVQSVTPPDGVTLTNPTVVGDLTVDTNTLFVDSTNNRVGVGTASPTKTLHVASDGPQLLLEDTAGGNNEDYSFGVNFGTLTIRNESIGSDIQILSDTEQQFLTSGVERARIDASGVFRIGGQTGTLQLGNDGTYYADIEWEYANNELAFTANNVANFTFNSNGSERVRIQSGGGISFNGDTAAANALDDYEEGTFNVSIVFGGNTPSGISYSMNAGSYTKVGRVVHCTFGLNASWSSSTGGGDLRINGLPFTEGRGGGYVEPGFAIGNKGLSSFTHAAVGASSTQLVCYKSDSSNSFVGNDFNSGGAGSFWFHGTLTYMTT